jgi:hypothetical protein|tara:strand:+ start:277 stop:444 length:168 start_codon:yes stop_codon:yes gene_type:complete
MLKDGSTMEQMIKETGRNQSFIRLVISRIRQLGYEVGFRITIENSTYQIEHIIEG